MYVFVTASNALYSESRRYNVMMAEKKGRFDKILAYDFETMIDVEFRKQNDTILSIKQGAGLWLWKPYFVHKALIEECVEGDILFYLDAAAFFISDVRMIEKVMDDDIYATCLPYIEADWTKNEAFSIMGMDKDVYKDSFQYQASFMAFRKSVRSIMFVEEWLNTCCNPNLVSPFQNMEKQIETFQNHRMDQSCFSLLCKKYNVRSHKDPTQFGVFGYPGVKGARYVRIKAINEYPIVIVLHRLENFRFRNKLKLAKRTICLIGKNIIKSIRKKKC